MPGWNVCGMPSKHDAVVIGAGHNGLTAGFKFSVCSYVVSLLRPEIIRELQLASHGLEILPLDGTFTDDSPHEGRSGPQRNVGYQTLDEAWTDVEVDLSEYAGRQVYLRFVYTPQPGKAAFWNLTNLRVIRRD